MSLKEEKNEENDINRQHIKEEIQMIKNIS